MRNLVAIIGCSALAVTVLVAQREDPDRMVKGGALPPGWMARLDNGSTKTDGVNLMSMGSTLHFVTGPAGIYYRAADTKSGTYEVHATLTQMAPSGHREAYGIFIGGSDLAGPNQKYTYFEIGQDGMFLVKRRAGAATPTIKDWSPSSAIKKTEGSAHGKNVLSIAVAPDKVRFLVNGTEVASAAPSQVDTSGIAGLRINHNLNVQVEDFGVK
jgi:hypothetical protein